MDSVAPAWDMKADGVESGKGSIRGRNQMDVWDVVLYFHVNQVGPWPQFRDGLAVFDKIHPLETDMFQMNDFVFEIGVHTTCTL